jgi:flagellar basal-body rod modification protein FlgD
MIGRDVRAAGDELIVGENNNPEFGYYLPDGAGAVVVTIFNDDGNVVRTLAFANPETGSNTHIWDGNDATGQRVDPGIYRVEVNATNADGSDVASTTTVTGHVDGVTFQNGQAWLLVGEREIPLASVLEVFESKAS